MQRAAPVDTESVADFIESLDTFSPSPLHGDSRDSSVVHLWLIDQTTDQFLAAAERATLSLEDKARAVRLKSETARRLFRAQRSALRLILAHHLGRPAKEVRLICLPGGKPALAPMPGDPPLCFSLAHSGNCFALAVGSVSLGIDIEAPRRVTHADAIAERWFLPAERAALASHSGEERFLALWTAKEALAKRHGAGLRLMRADADELAIAPEWRSGRLKLFRVPSGGVGALAANAPVPRISVTETLPAG